MAAFAAGAMLSLGMLLLYWWCVSTPVVKVLHIPPNWNGETHVWLDGWTNWGKDLGQVTSVSPHNANSIRAALRPGDRVEIATSRLKLSLASDLILFTYILEGPAGRRSFHSASDGLQ